MGNRIAAVVLLMAAAVLACCVQEQQTTTTTTSSIEQTTATTLAIEGYYTCSDSDGGLNALKKGVLKEEYKETMGQTGSEILTYDDRCIDNDTVLEYYCNDSVKTIYEGDACVKGIICGGGCNRSLKTASIDCQKGYSCIDGACADADAEKKPNGLECGGDQECASGHCTQNYTYTHIQHPESRICCEEGECGFRGRCYENNRPVWMCSCKNSQLVACTTTTSRSL